jgi:CheY-like chemotaxis protein
MPRQINILLIEDDEIDVEAVARAFRHEAKLNFVVANSGVEALNSLRGEAGYQPVPYPYIILLDLNMPQMSGFEFLASLRSDPRLRETVVFVLTTSDRDEDRVMAFEYCVAGYFLKPRIDASYTSLVTFFKSYQQMAEFPPQRVV